MSRIVYLSLLLLISGCESTPEPASITGPSGIAIYPNPATTLVVVSFNNPESSGSVKVFDSTAEMFFSNSLTNGDNSFNISLDSRPAGIYHVEVQSGNKKSISKFIKLE